MRVIRHIRIYRLFNYAVKYQSFLTTLLLTLVLFFCMGVKLIFFRFQTKKVLITLLGKST